MYILTYLISVTMIDLVFSGGSARAMYHLMSDTYIDFVL